MISIEINGRIVATNADHSEIEKKYPDAELVAPNVYRVGHPIQCTCMFCEEAQWAKRSNERSES